MIAMSQPEGFAILAMLIISICMFLVLLLDKDDTDT